MKIYTDKDADLAVLKGKTCAVLGFGSQGHAHALNLKESGVKVIIGLYPGSKSRAVAAEKGFPVFDTAEAVKKADVIFVAVPDTKQPDAFEKDIRPLLRERCEEERFVDTAQRLGVAPFKEYVYATPIKVGHLVGEDEYV